MPRTVYALLVGIDKYPAPTRPLNGCVNDIQRVQAFLADRVGRTGDRFEPLLLLDDCATRQAMVDGFRQHLRKAAQDDVALFYYSGHGSQQQSPQEFWHLEPDHLDETLVCWNSRLENGWDLADKELAQLITEVAANGPHIAVILDCCHSGSGTRAPEERVGVRRVPVDERQRPLESFIVTIEQVRANQSPICEEGGSGWFTLPTGRHVVLAACRAEEEAKEYFLGGEMRGIFSYYFLDTLQNADQMLTYRDLSKRINALVRANVASQDPQIEATTPDDLGMPFLGGVVGSRTPYFTASYDNNRNWVIDGGIVHGIQPLTNNETTLLALFPFGAPLDDHLTFTQAIGQARVTKVMPTISWVEMTLSDGSRPNQDTTYKAIVVALPLPPLAVHLEGDRQALQLIREALAHACPKGEASLLVREGDEMAELLLTAADDRFRITRPADPYPLAVDIDGFTEASALLSVQRLEHISQWNRLLRLRNPASRLPQNAVTMTAYWVNEGEGLAEMSLGNGPLRFEYEHRNGKWQPAEFKLKLTNTSKRELYCMLLDLPLDYSIYTGLFPGGGVWLQPGEEAWANNGKPIPAWVPQTLWEQGIIEIQDILKLIVSTEKCDAAGLEQDSLEVRVRGRGKGLLPIMNTLDRLMQRVQIRHLKPEPEANDALADWQATEVAITIVRPLEVASVGKIGESISLGSGVELEGHAHLKAMARLTTVSEAGRDLGNLLLPALLRDDPTVSQSLQFSAGRRGEPGLSVLELIDVVDHTVVTPNEPLIVHSQFVLSPNEYVLPVAFDGEFFLPLGRIIRRGDGLDIALECLPAPTTRGVRDLKGSIRILFQKIIRQPLGLDYPYPLLAVATVDNTVHYDADSQAVAKKVAMARRIVLYIHGIIGDTRDMALSVHWQPTNMPLNALTDRYDLILTFDYENLNTTIEDTARALKQRLETVGLGPGHGKMLHIVAHSMGGLVARWFIEHEGGNNIVQRLIMLGTPNAGSPWPTIQGWATLALGIGLNTLSSVAWPAKILGSLVSAIETIDVTLDEMQPGSTFYKSLETGLDPNIPYRVIIGNTSIRPTVEENTFARLIRRLPQKLLHEGTALAFFGQANDIAVSVASAKTMPSNRSMQLKVDVVACDHITYFTAQAGLEALNESLLQ